MKVLVLALLLSLGPSLSHAQVSAPTIAPNLDIINYALSSPEVQKVLGKESIEKISISQENISTTWTYTMSIQTLRNGLGANGPSTAPCYATIIVHSNGGIAGTSLSRPEISMVCAQH